MDQRRFIAIVIAATLAIDGLAWGLTHIFAWHGFDVLLMLLCLAQFNLLGIWLTLGTGIAWRLRLLISVCAVGVVQVLMNMTHNTTDANVLALYAMIQVTAMAAVVLLWRRAGYRWQHCERQAHESSEQGQSWRALLTEVLAFSLGFLLLGTIGSYVVETQLGLVVVFFTSTVLASSVAWFARYGGSLLRRTMGTVGVSLSFGITLGMLSEVKEFVPIAMFYGLFIFGWIKLREWGGYAIQRIPVTTAAPQRAESPELLPPETTPFASA